MKKRQPVLGYLGKQPPAGELAGQFEAEGFAVRAMTTMRQLEHVLHKTPPHSLIIDLAGQVDCLACLDQVRDVLTGTDRLPRLLVLSDRADQEVRLRAVQAGVDAFLVKPVNPRMLMPYLVPVYGRRGQDYRVLLIDERPDGLAGHIDHLKQAGMKIRHLRNPSQALLSMINFMPDIVLVTCELTGCRGDDIGRMVHQLVDYEDMPVIYLCSDEGDVFTPRDTAPCEVIPVSVSGAELLSRLERLVQATRNRRRKIQYLQNCDRTTGLLNRDGFFMQLERGVSAVDSVALIVFELEDLQHQNPGLSPRQLDDLLVLIANELSRHVTSAQVSARVGDCVFAFLLADKTGEEVRQLGQLLSHTISSQIFDIGDFAITVGCNAGISRSRCPLPDGLPLYSLALEACTEARHAGSCRVSMRELDIDVVLQQTGRDRGLSSLITRALDEDLFRLVFQPIASLHGNSIEKYEVLLRLYDSSGEPVLPSRFVPVAEQCGLMQSIDRWVVEQAVVMLRNRGNGTSLFVKISSGSMQGPGFTTWLSSLFEGHGLPGNCLVFEIREDNMRASLRHAADFAGRIRRLGCGIALEHSDISRDVEPILKHIPAQYVKINGQAINRITANREQQSQLKAVITMSEQHKARVIAGFVENANSLQLLWRYGVPYIQGNFLQVPDESLDFDFGEEVSG